MYKRFIEHIEEFDFVWDEKKNDLLQHGRGMRFEYLIGYMLLGNVIHLEDDLNYDDQYLIVVVINGYCWKVACTITGNICRLITAFPSRQATKFYLRS